MQYPRGTALWLEHLMKKAARKKSKRLASEFPTDFRSKKHIHSNRSSIVFSPKTEVGLTGSVMRQVLYRRLGTHGFYDRRVQRAFGIVTSLLKEFHCEDLDQIFDEPGEIDEDYFDQLLAGETDPITEPTTETLAETLKRLLGTLHVPLLGKLRAQLDANGRKVKQNPTQELHPSEWLDAFRSLDEETFDVFCMVMDVIVQVEANHAENGMNVFKLGNSVGLFLMWHEKPVNRFVEAQTDVTILTNIFELAFAAFDDYELIFASMFNAYRTHVSQMKRWLEFDARSVTEFKTASDWNRDPNLFLGPVPVPDYCANAMQPEATVSVRNCALYRYHWEAPLQTVAILPPDGVAPKKSGECKAQLCRK